MTRYNGYMTGIGTGTGKRRKRKLWIWLFSVCVAAGICWVLYCLAEIGSAERNPAANRAYGEPADVGIVLGASMWGESPSPGLRERLELALSDYKAGKFRVFILTGGLDRPDYPYTEAEGMANYLEANGVPRSDMILENEATSTYENLKFSQELMKEKGYASAVILTHTYHGNRALEIAETLNYSNPGLSLTETKVLKPAQTTLREVLAYTKWKLDQLLLVLGWK
ncbi:YdcF family protein [Paenibacillus sp. alder61]|nr:MULTISPECIES: YdcF family protein [Paenibacillus]MCA1291998.1 YdcF family protein [Paenibacillus sp. alder61]